MTVMEEDSRSGLVQYLNKMEALPSPERVYGKANEKQLVGGNAMQKIVPYLWFNTQAEEAAHFYTSLFQDAEVLSATPGPDGKVMSATFQLEGQEFIALNGGPEFTFTEAVSFFVKCETQEEVDRL